MPKRSIRNSPCWARTVASNSATRCTRSSSGARSASRCSRNTTWCAPACVARACRQASCRTDTLVAQVAARLQSALDAALLPGAPPLRLSALDATRLRAEMEFDFVLKAASMRRLREACAAHGEPDLVPPGNDRVLRGLMIGKIDLVFEHAGRFHVLDYKSNHLGERLSDYAPAALHEAMDAHAYRFQALLYTVALDRYLRQRMRSYRRDRHLGEAIYLFVRAVGLAPGIGAWTQRFDDSLIGAVDAALAADAMTEAA